MPGLQAVKESGVHLKIHRLANLATVLATLQKERVPRLEKIDADEVLPQYQDHYCTENHISTTRSKLVILDQRWLYSGRW